MVAAALIGVPAVAWAGSGSMAESGLGAWGAVALPGFFEPTREEHPKLFIHDAPAKTGLEQVKAAVSTDGTLRVSRSQCVTVWSF